MQKFCSVEEVLTLCKHCTHRDKERIKLVTETTCPQYQMFRPKVNPLLKTCDGFKEEQGKVND